MWPFNIIEGGRLMEGRLIEFRLYIYLAKLSINICDATVRKKSAFKAKA